MAMLGQCYYRVASTRLGRRAAGSTLEIVRRLGGLRAFASPLDCLSLPHEAVVELMRLWRGLHWTSADGMMTPEERLAIYVLAYRSAACGDFVELGAWKGLTTCYLAAACRARGAGHVYAVDTFEGTRENETRYASIENYNGSTLGEFERFIARTEMKDWVTPCVGYTTEVVRQHRNRHIAFLLIDADHSYEGARADFNAWFPLVAEGGVVAFHDYAMPEAGVAAFVDGEVAGRDDVRIILHNLPPNVFAIMKKAPSQH